VYALLAVPFTEWFEPEPIGDFVIADVTNPRQPRIVGEWGAGRHGFSPGPFFGMGSFGAMYAHSVRASADGTKAYVSYWDLGVVTLDISDVRNPRLVSRTNYPRGAEGEAHSVVPYGRFLLQNDEDFDPRGTTRIRYAAGGGEGSESPAAAPLWLEPNHRVSGRVVRVGFQGCRPGDYPANADGAIVVVRTRVPFFDPRPGPEPACSQAQQQQRAEAAGAIALVHDFISQATSPQWWDEIAEVGIPVVYTDHRTARGIVSAGRGTLIARPPSWGFLRIFDATTGRQVAQFDDLPFVHSLRRGESAWSIHNTEVAGARAYSSWYSYGIVALDLSPLARAGVGDPVKVGQFVPPAAGSPGGVLPRGAVRLGCRRPARSGLRQ
jgi:hypothetical protein